MIKPMLKTLSGLERLIKRILLQTYKGMQDEAGNFVEFTPGRATGYRDVG